MRLKGFSSIISLGCLLMVSGDRECSWSRDTVQLVDSCPFNSITYEQRRKDKNCEATAKRQNCTTPSKFLYHCLINEYGNALIEVCAPIYIINGYCAEYNTVGARIQPHYSLKCDNISPQCAERYNSTDAFLYTGCFENVKNRKFTTNVNTDNVFTTESSTSLGQMPVREHSNLDTQPAALIAVITIAVIVVVAVVAVLVLVIRRRGYLCVKVSEGKDSECQEQSSLLSLNNEQTSLSLAESVTNGNCDRSRYETFITLGKTLRDTLVEEGDILQDKMDENKEKTSKYLEVYKRVNNHFVETSFTKKCASKLSRLGMIVLIGEQGSGKTSTAVHIMNSSSYLKWSKHKITSFSELLVLEFEDKTLIYMDNAFDGFMYHQELNKWWQSLCYFYFQILTRRNNIRLLITAKPNQIEKACSFVKADVRFISETCFVRVDSFPLSEKEKLNILESQIKLASELKHIETFIVTEKMKDKIKGKTYSIGFPLCAHLYCFETNTNLRDTSIFDDPRSYVRRQIKEEIDGDGSNGVKTLLLLLVYYFSSGTSYLSENLDLKYEADCDTLRKKCPEVLLEQFEPLSFKNLNERAEMLNDDVLIKHHTLYEFKHQVYLEEVSNYFFRANFNAVVDHFPLSILRAYEMDDFSQLKINKFICRLKQEIEQGAISEALNCKLFQEPKFEEEFCNDLRKDIPFMEKLLSIADETSGFKFPIIFWVSKYNMLKLKHMVLDFAKRKIDELLPFYLVLFGECCAKDESYIRLAEFPLQKEDIQSLVLAFKTNQGTISDLILSSETSEDNNASHILDRILKESNLEWKESFLDYIIDQIKPSE